MNLLGQHMQSTGLLEVWTESYLMGQKTVENVMAGKDFSKYVCAHKITSQGLWQIILPQLLNFIQNEDIDMKNSSENAADYDSLIRVFSGDKFCNILSHFVNSHRSDPNFMFWWDYLQMVKVLLMFIRSQREYGIYVCLHSVLCYHIFIGMQCYAMLCFHEEGDTRIIVHCASSQKC